MWVFCDILSYIWNHFWDILQTLLGLVALVFAMIAWYQYKQDKKIEYWKLDYQLSKELYDYYTTDPKIANLIDIWHPEGQDIPKIKERLQNNMIKATHELQKLLIVFIHQGIEFPDEPDSLL